MISINQRLAITAFVSLTLVTTAGRVGARDGLRVSNNGVVVTMTPGETPSGNVPVVESDWVIRSAVNQVVLHWQTTPFIHLENDEIKTDAVIAVAVTDTWGRIQASPSRSRDRTNVADGDDSASVAMGLRRPGSVDVRMRIGMDDRHAVAGRHCADVTLTLTSH
tara:strand:+ start:247173 stop:247664 length:492 start_codon:yes stop_codon:yes gene_type:complete